MNKVSLKQHHKDVWRPNTFPFIGWLPGHGLTNNTHFFLELAAWDIAKY